MPHHSVNTINHRRGFTIIEMLVVAPIVILFIGAFIAAIVSMTGQVLTTRASNMLTYNIQDALNRIEQDVSSGASFLSTNNIPITTPQGYDNDTTSFKNVGTNGNMLIINTSATTKNPVDPDSNIVYTHDQPNGCSSDNISVNPAVKINVVYFVRDSALYRRVVMPSFYDTVGCSVPWQTPTCAQDITGGQCSGTDTKLVDGIDSVDDFKIDYYPTPSSTNPSADTINAALDNNDRQSALNLTKSVKVTINTTSTIAGRTVKKTGSIRASSPNGDSSTTLNEQAASIISQPSNTTVNAGTNAVFTASASGTNLDTQWQKSTNNGFSWVNISGATSTTLTITSPSNTMDGYQYRAIFSNSFGSVTTSPARMGVNYLSWTALSMSSRWSNYSSAFSSAAYRKTSDGVVILKGLVKKSSSVSSGEVIGTLPESYRPTDRLVFTTSTNANVYSRVDVDTDGNIMAAKADNGWVSLEGIHFIPDNGRYTQNLLLPFDNGWTSYVQKHGSNYAEPSYATDDSGRIHLQGVASGGTTTTNTVIVPLPSNTLPELYMHFPAGNNTYTHISVNDDGVLAKNGSNGYLSFQAMYYPESTGTWSDLSLQHGWRQYHSSYSSPQYIKASDGLVSIKGLIKSGSTGAGTVIATLPVGYRPLARSLFAVVSSNAWGRLDIQPNGDLLFQSGSNGWFSLDGVTFYADQ